MDRRLFVKKLGWGTASLATTTIVLEACSSGSQSAGGSSLSPYIRDDLQLSSGLDYHILIKELDLINEDMSFGSDNAGIVFLQESSEEGYLWINHETVNPVLASGYDDTKGRHRNMILTEMYRVGGTILKVKRISGSWTAVRNDIDNYRVIGASKVPINWSQPIAGYNSVVGTVANRGACKTPWGTILSAEHNYTRFYGEYDEDFKHVKNGDLMWQSFFPDHHPHHFGWIVEVQPSTGSAKKHIAMGRMFHGDVEIKSLPNGQVAIYTIDDRNQGCIYKFISENANSLDSGKLYVANMDENQWELMDISRPELSGNFQDQTELLIRAGEAAEAIGGTSFDSPSGLVIDPESGDLILAVRGDKSKGAMWRISESSNNDVQAEEIISGGQESGFVHPSALAFGPDGRLWFASAIPPRKIGKGDYEPFGNNGLFVMDLNKSEPPVRMGSAPMDAEFAGMHFTGDGETMFLSVQHPGAQTQNLNELTSNWPGGGTTVPLSAVVTVTGSGLNLKNNPT